MYATARGRNNPTVIGGSSIPIIVEGAKYII